MSEVDAGAAGKSKGFGFVVMSSIVSKHYIRPTAYLATLFKWAPLSSVSGHGIHA
jgi:hypothetical protein